MLECINRSCEIENRVDDQVNDKNRQEAVDIRRNATKDGDKVGRKLVPSRANHHKVCDASRSIAADNDTASNWV